MDGGSPGRSSFRSPKKHSPSHDLRGDPNAARQAANLSFASNTSSFGRISSLSTSSISQSQPAALIAARTSGIRSAGSSIGNQSKPADASKITYTPAPTRVAASRHIDPLIAAQASVNVSSSRSDAKNSIVEVPFKVANDFSLPLIQGSNPTSPDIKHYDDNGLKLLHRGHHHRIDGNDRSEIHASTPSALAANLAASKGIGIGNDRGRPVKRLSDLESDVPKSFRAGSPQKEHATISASIAFNSRSGGNIAAARKIFETQRANDEAPRFSGVQNELFAPRPLQASSPLLEKSAPSISSALTAALTTFQRNERPHSRPISVATSRAPYIASSNAFEAAAIAVRNDTRSRERKELISRECKVSKESPVFQPMDCEETDGQILDSQGSSFDDAQWSIYQNPPYTRSTRSIPNDFAVSDTALVSGTATISRPMMIPVGYTPTPNPLTLKSEQSLQPSHTGDSMRYAIAASSLASSRGHSPAKGLTAPATQPRTHAAMRTTMRKDKKQKVAVPQEMDYPEYRQLRRYESLWASNRGLYLDSLSNPDGVCFVIIKDIWSRSRLPLDVLENIWDLVYRRPDVYRSYLTRDEFILGLFLIDRSLMGMKTPPRIDDELWDSVFGNGFFTNSSRKNFERRKMKKKGKKG